MTGPGLKRLLKEVQACWQNTEIGDAKVWRARLEQYEDEEAFEAVDALLASDRNQAFGPNLAEIIQQCARIARPRFQREQGDRVRAYLERVEREEEEERRRSA